MRSQSSHPRAYIICRCALAVAVPPYHLRSMPPQARLCSSASNVPAYGRGSHWPRQGADAQKENSARADTDFCLGQLAGGASATRAN
eukprot:gene10725-biopygen4064